MPIHHKFKKGQRVLVILHDRRYIVDKFLEVRTRDKLKLENHTLRYKDIRAVVIFRKKVSNYEKN